ncbi:fimbrial protein [Kluyvera cryocrescens]|uniref:fimbrial protein n=1 Tax=Kluyvera cryocrescens TaxID=580 RepID=UPI003D7F21CA
MMIAAGSKPSALSLIGMLLLAVGHPATAAQALDMTITANVMEDHCAIQIEPSTVELPMIAARTLDEDGQTPTDFGSQASFNVEVTDCDDADQLSALHFSIQPASGVFPAGYQQVFANDLPVESKGAGGVGIVVFWHDGQQNVLNNDGTSDVVVPTTPDNYRQRYAFDVRYQKIGSVSAGLVSTTLLVDVEYQ